MNPQIVLVIPILLFAVIIHECAHGWVAYRLGDPTAKMAGRLTLNPIPHIDPVGTIILPLLFVIMGSLGAGPPIIFAWAKPVPINPYYFPNPKKGMMMVGLSGPLSNFAQAVIMALLLRLFVSVRIDFLNQMLYLGVFINVFLGVLNMVPVPPLDGSRVLAGFLPDHLAKAYYQLESIGMFLVVALLVTGVIRTVVVPIALFFAKILLGPYF